MSDWDAIVIGSGLGGLSAAAVMARVGRRVLVLERLPYVGGAATTYRHDRLQTEASLHEVDGEAVTAPNGALHRLGVAARLTPIYTEEFYEVRSPLFRPLRVPHSVSGMEAAIGAAFPGAQTGVHRYGRVLRGLHGVLETLQGSVGEANVAVGLLLSGRAFEIMGRIRLTVDEAMTRLFGSDEPPKLALCAPLNYVDDDPKQTSFLAYADIISRHLHGGSIYFAGGSRAIVAALTTEIIAHGGKIRTGRTVRTILLDARGNACGVRHSEALGVEEEETSSVLFGNAAPSVLGAMLPPERRERFAAAFAGKSPSQSLFSIALGLDRPAAAFGVSAYQTFIYPDWLQKLDHFGISADVFGGEPGAAMPLYGVIDYSRLNAGVRCERDLHHISLTGADRLWAWEGYDDGQDHERRERWIDAFVLDLDRRFPGIKAAVCHREMATARTMRNRLGSPHGEVYGFKPTPERLFARRLTLETTIRGLFVASAYTLSGGFAGALDGGRLAAEAALASTAHHRRTRVRTSLPV